MQLQQNPLKLECPIIPEIDSPKKIIRISTLIFMELFTKILILVLFSLFLDILVNYCLKLRENVYSK